MAPVLVMRLILLNIFRLLLLLFVVAAVRSLIGYAARAFSRAGVTGGGSQPAAATKSGGELRKDPVCGVFISEASSVKTTINGQTFHFCSAACRNKYHPA